MDPFAKSFSYQRPLDPAVDPDREYTYKVTSRGRRVNLTYSGSLTRSPGPTMRGSSTSVHRHRGIGCHERGGITQSIRGCVVGNAVRLSPSTTSARTQPDPIGPAPNRSPRVRSMRQERPPIPHFVLHENPVADPIASSVDQATAAAIST